MKVTGVSIVVAVHETVSKALKKRNSWKSEEELRPPKHGII